MLAVFTAVLSCESMPEPEDVASSQTGFVAVSEGGDVTKAFLDSDLKIEWNSGDRIAVFGSDGKHLFTTEDQGGKAVFTSGTPCRGTEWYALYPYSESCSFADGSLSAVLPSEQTAVVGSFAPDADIAMAYTLSDELRFLNAVSFIRIGFRTSVNDARIKKITFESIDPSILLSGNLAIYPQIASGTLSSLLTVVSEGVPYVSLSAPEGEFLQPGTDYYLAAVPSSLASGYRITLTDESGVSFSREYSGDSYRSAYLKRNMIEPVGVKNLDAYEHQFECYARLRSEADFTPGAYLFVRSMGGGYRVFDCKKSSPYISSGTPLVDKFFNPAYSASNNTNKSSILLDLKNDVKRWPVKGAPDFISDFVHYALKDAWSDSDDRLSAFTFADDSFIFNPSDACAIVVKEDRSIIMPLYFNNIETHRMDSALVSITGCTASLDASDGALIKGKMTEAAVDELLRVLYVGKGESFLSSAEEYDLRTPAMSATTVTTTVGFCSAVQTTADGEEMKDMFMISNKFLCNSPASPGRISLYKKGCWAVTYADYMSSFGGSN